MACYTVTTEGLRLSSQAFSERNKQASVDRAELCNSDPSWTQGNDERNGVVYLVTEEVRAIGDNLVTNSPQGDRTSHEVDVIPDVLTLEKHGVHNPAHALVVATPNITSNSTYKRLKEALARLVNSNQGRWLIYPANSR